MKYEERIKKIDEHLKTLERSDVDLESMIEAYKQGMHELKEARKMLQDARAQIEECSQVSQNPQGSAK